MFFSRNDFCFCWFFQYCIDCYALPLSAFNHLLNTVVFRETVFLATTERTTIGSTVLRSHFLRGFLKRVVRENDYLVEGRGRGGGERKKSSEIIWPIYAQRAHEGERGRVESFGKGRLGHRAPQAKTARRRTEGDAAVFGCSSCSCKMSRFAEDIRCI